MLLCGTCFGQSLGEQGIDRSWNDVPITYPVGKQAIVYQHRMRIPKGSSSPWHYHPVQTLTYVVSGFVLLQDNQGTLLGFERGDLIVEGVNNIHRIIAGNTQDVELLVINLGMDDLENVVSIEEER